MSPNCANDSPQQLNFLWVFQILTFCEFRRQRPLAGLMSSPLVSFQTWPEGVRPCAFARDTCWSQSLRTLHGSEEQTRQAMLHFLNLLSSPNLDSRVYVLQNCSRRTSSFVHTHTQAQKIWTKWTKLVCNRVCHTSWIRLMSWQMNNGQKELNIENRLRVCFEAKHITTSQVNCMRSFAALWHKTNTAKRGQGRFVRFSRPSVRFAPCSVGEDVDSGSLNPASICSTFDVQIKLKLSTKLSCTCRK